MPRRISYRFVPRLIGRFKRVSLDGCYVVGAPLLTFQAARPLAAQRVVLRKPQRVRRRLVIR